MLAFEKAELLGNGEPDVGKGRSGSRGKSAGTNAVVSPRGKGGQPGGKNVRFRQANRGAVRAGNKKECSTGDRGPGARPHLGSARPNNAGAGGVLEQTHP